MGPPSGHGRKPWTQEESRSGHSSEGEKGLDGLGPGVARGLAFLTRAGTDVWEAPMATVGALEDGVGSGAGGAAVSSAAEVAAAGGDVSAGATALAAGVIIW